MHLRKDDRETSGKLVSVIQLWRLMSQSSSFLRMLSMDMPKWSLLQKSQILTSSKCLCISCKNRIQGMGIACRRIYQERKFYYAVCWWDILCRFRLRKGESEHVQEFNVYLLDENICRWSNRSYFLRQHRSIHQSLMWSKLCHSKMESSRRSLCWNIREKRYQRKWRAIIWLPVWFFQDTLHKMLLRSCQL